MLSRSQIDAVRPSTVWLRLQHSLQDPNFIHLGSYAAPHQGLRAIVTLDLMDAWDAGAWLHVSVSRASRLPTWDDLVKAREELGYGDRLFVQLLPPRSHWLNVAGHVLHLWHRIDAPTVPWPLWDQVGADGAGYRRPGTLDGKG